MNLWKAQARTAAASGQLEVRRQGESTNRKISIGRHMSAAAAGDWILVAEDAGACLGNRTARHRTDRLPQQPSRRRLNPSRRHPDRTAPPAWTAWFQHGGVGIYDGGSSWTFGRDRQSFFYFDPVTFESSWTTYYDQLVDAISVYSGLAGLSMDSITLQLVAPGITSTTAKLVLFQAPTSRPSSAASITQRATVAAPALPDTGGRVPASRCPRLGVTQLAAGTANGVGILDAPYQQRPAHLTQLNPGSRLERPLPLIGDLDDEQQPVQQRIQLADLGPPERPRRAGHPSLRLHGRPGTPGGVLRALALAAS